MPELPEVETTRRGIAPHLLHQVIRGAVVRQRQLRWPVPDLAGLLSAFGSCVGDSGFVAAADIDGNGCIDLADLAGLLANFGA